ncbi:hypothetical protein BpHYR1_013170 [Brachionus plicatilis]|uniref:Uncharacterized protein n=1 Tax=Brachionus plicatilis TaxID=10195 RepID=A0A3M7T363_BRAPC|nr:hypothetical protein BpHYR1_013170 [Brachionus plicatilis]
MYSSFFLFITQENIKFSTHWYIVLLEKKGVPIFIIEKKPKRILFFNKILIVRRFDCIKIIQVNDLINPYSVPINPNINFSAKKKIEQQKTESNSVFVNLKNKIFE